MEDRIFTNLMASRPTKDRRWVIWLLVAAAHVIVIGALMVIPDWSRSDEVIEIFHEPIILDDVPRIVTPLPEANVKPAETKPTEAKPGEATPSNPAPGRAPGR